VFSDLVGSAPNLSSNMLTDPSLAWVVDRNVGPAMRHRICEHTEFLGVADDCLNAAIGALVDLRLRNLATIKTRGIDLISRYNLDLKHSTLTFGLLGTKVLQYAEKQTVSSPLVNLLDTEHNPIDLRLRASITWKSGGFSMAFFGNFQNAYRDLESQRRVSSLTTADVTLQYALPDAWNGALGRLSVSVSGLNVFNTYPPFINNYAEQIGYDEENGDLIGRTVTLTLRKRW
jgi:outer membrane receptor protein involved in Fe transport